jgi:predicted GNAT family acetyltransferase
MDIPITHEAQSRRFIAIVDGRESKVEYSLQGNIMTILHTEVPPELGGRGIAGQLVRAALEYAREQNWRVVPVCSYAASYLDRHPEYADLLA